MCPEVTPLVRLLALLSLLLVTVEPLNFCPAELAAPGWWLDDQGKQ